MGKARPLRQWISKAAGTVNECGAQSFHAGQFVGVGALGQARFGQPDRWSRQPTVRLWASIGNCCHTVLPA